MVMSLTVRKRTISKDIKGIPFGHVYRNKYLGCKERQIDENQTKAPFWISQQNRGWIKTHPSNTPQISKGCKSPWSTELFCYVGVNQRILRHPPWQPKVGDLRRLLHPGMDSSKLPVCFDFGLQLEWLKSSHVTSYCTVYINLSKF